MAELPPTRRNLAALDCVDLPALGEVRIKADPLLYLPLCGEVGEPKASRVGGC